MISGLPVAVGVLAATYILLLAALRVIISRSKGAILHQRHNSLHHTCAQYGV